MAPWIKSFHESIAFTFPDRGYVLEDLNNAHMVRAK